MSSLVLEWVKIDLPVVLDWIVPVTAPEVLLQPEKINLAGFFGPPGVGGSHGGQISIPINGVGSISVSIPSAVKSGVLAINGIIQTSDNYAIVGGSLVLPGAMGLQPGDVVTLDY